MKEYDENMSLQVVNKNELEELVNQSKKVIAMGFPSENPRYNEMMHSYHNFALHYSNDAVFVIYQEEYAKAEAEKMGSDLPFAFYYENKKLASGYPYLDNEAGFVRILELIFHHDDPLVVLTVDELYRSIGDLNFAILAPTPELYLNGIKLHFNQSVFLAEIDVIKVAPDVLSELNLDPTQSALFRKEDCCIVSFKSLNQDFKDDILSFFNASLPVYKIYQGADFINENYEMFVLTSPTLTDEMKDFLFEIASKYKEYNFGYLKPDFLKIGELVINESFPNKLNIYFCNFARRWYIDIEDIFTWEFIHLPFDKNKWMQKIEFTIEKAIKNGRKKNYFSEPVPSPIPGSLIKKVVGLTYKDFINDPEHDVLMMYVGSNCENCRKFKPIFVNFVKEFKATGKTFLKFGWINYEKNSSEEKFPYIPGLPHFELFPAKNKSEHDSLKGMRSRDNLVRFLKDRCLEEFPLTAPPPDKRQTALQLMTMLLNMPKQVPDEEYPKYLKYIAETSESIGIDLSTIPGFEEYSNKLSPSFQNAKDEATKNSVDKAKILQKQAKDNINYNDEFQTEKDNEL